MEEFLRSKKGALLILAVIALIFFFPILSNIDNWGVRDWGFHLFMNDVEKKSIEEYNQFPFWNPYRCGGNIDFAHPENPILSVHFILVMLMGTMAAIKIDIILYAIIGMFGMFLISDYLKLGTYSSYLPPILYILNSSLILTLAEGNYWVRGIIWLPWIAYFFLRCKENAKFIFPAAFFMLMIFFDTNSYAFGILIFFLIVYGAVDWLLTKKPKMLVAAILILAVAGALGAVKFLPMIEFTHQYPQTRVDTTSGYNFQSFYDGLFNREQGPYSHWYENQIPFFLHGMYLGFIPVILAVLGVLLYYRKYLALLITAILGLIVSFGKYSMINLYAVLKAIPLYDYFHQATRFNIVFIFALAVFAGLFLSRIENSEGIKINNRKIKISKSIILIIILIIMADMFIVNTPVLKKIFIASPLPITGVSPEFYQTTSPYGSNPWTDGKVIPDLYYNVWGHAMYLNMEKNTGTENGNCHGTVNMSAQPKYLINSSANPLYKGETYLLGSGKAQISKFTPNKVTVSVEASSDDTLVLNQNYYTSWRSTAGEVFNYQGLAAVKVNPSVKEVMFYHSPTSFWIGLVITIIALAISILFYINFDKLAEKFKFIKLDF